MMSLKHLALAAPFVCLACVPSPTSQALKGVWVSNGYGIGAEISGRWLDSYAVADKTCISEGRDPLFGLLAEYDVTLAEDGQSFVLGFEGSSQTIRFDRRAALPAPCLMPPADTPLGNFEVFADIFATHYAFFDIYGVDWGRAVARARQHLTPEMTDQALFELFTGLLAPLKDGHIGLKAKINGTRQLYEPNPGALFARIRAAAEAAGKSPDDAEKAFRKAYREDHIRDRILSGTGEVAGNGFVQYGVIAPQTGYINFLTMAGYTDGDIGAPVHDLAVINEIMDDVIDAFDSAGVTRVIVDASLNFGGFDDVALELAGRFAARPVLALSEYPADARDKVSSGRTVVPSERPRFTGDLILVTSNMTVSAGEIFTLALRALPQTTHVGAPTRGALSDVLEKTLPNGWIVELSNEVYSDHRGVKWEGRGIMPERRLPVFRGAAPLDTHAALIARLAGE